MIGGAPWHRCNWGRTTSSPPPRYFRVDKQVHGCGSQPSEHDIPLRAHGLKRRPACRPGVSTSSKPEVSNLFAEIMSVNDTVVVVASPRCRKSYCRACPESPRDILKALQPRFIGIGGHGQRVLLLLPDWSPRCRPCRSGKVLMSFPSSASSCRGRSSMSFALSEVHKSLAPESTPYQLS